MNIQGGLTQYTDKEPEPRECGEGISALIRFI